jgi:hypothetical protein
MATLNDAADYPTPRGKDKANTCLQKVGELEVSVRTIEAARDAALAPLNAQAETIRQEAETKIAELLPQIEGRLRALRRWYRWNLSRYGKKGGRTIELASGTIGIKLDSAHTVEVLPTDENEIEAVTKAVRRRGLRFVKTSVTPNKRAIAANYRRFHNVPGLRFHRLERFYATPIALQGMQQPKDDRLRIVVKDLHQ